LFLLCFLQLEMPSLVPGYVCHTSVMLSVNKWQPTLLSLCTSYPSPRAHPLLSSSLTDPVISLDLICTLQATITSPSSTS
jgi:hypothetical protein